MDKYILGAVFIIFNIWLFMVFITAYIWFRHLAHSYADIANYKVSNPMNSNDLIYEIERIMHEHGACIPVVICKDSNEQGPIDTINYNNVTNRIELSIR